MDRDDDERAFPAQAVAPSRARTVGRHLPLRDAAAAFQARAETTARASS